MYELDTQSEDNSEYKKIQQSNDASILPFK
jgi:hypothetical protein